MEGHGSTSIWGLSKPLNLLHKNNSSISEQCPKLLLLGSADLRHILKTISDSAISPTKSKTANLEFFLVETQSTILARHMLHLSIILDDPSLTDPNLSLQDRAELYLESFSNILLREKTSNHIAEKALDLIRVITDSKGHLAKVIDFNLLKYRERDDIEFVFKFWRDEKKPFNVKALWDNRIRKYLQRRYDTRENIYDWDYNMKLLDRDASATIVHKHEYSRWREHGNAHEVRDSHYEYPNRTIATVDTLLQDGLKVNKWGIFSDILTGPFPCHSVDTEFKEYLEKSNDKHQYPCQVIAETNIKSIIHQINTGSLFTPSAPTLTEISDEQPSPPNFKLHFLPCDPSETLYKKKSKYAGIFRAVYVSTTLAHHIPDCFAVMEPGGLMFVETAQFMLDLTKEQVAAYSEKVKGLALSAGFVQCNNEAGVGVGALIFEKPFKSA